LGKAYTYLRMLIAALFLACAAADFQVTFKTDVPGDIVINVVSEWCPLGAAHFQALVEDKFYDAAAFFRVVPNFVVQFGIAGTPSENVKWKTPIKDDPVKHSNLKGTISYTTAGPNTRTTQLFINYIDNTGLDRQGFAPFGEVISGMDIAMKIFNPTPGSSGGVDQNSYETKGNAWIKTQYPKINFITNASITG